MMHRTAVVLGHVLPWPARSVCVWGLGLLSAGRTGTQ